MTGALSQKASRAAALGRGLTGSCRAGAGRLFPKTLGSAPVTADILRAACGHGRGFDDAEQTEAVSRWALAEIDRLRRRVELLEADIANVHRECDRHHTAFPGTWPYERVKLIVDDALSRER